MKFSLPTLEMQMTVIFITIQAFHFILKKFKIPKFTSQILAGLFLGPSLLGHYIKFFQYELFSIESQPIIGVLGEFGYGLFLFIFGVKMELELARKTGHKAMITGILCVIAPLVLGILVQNHLMDTHFKLSEDQMSKLPYIAIWHCITPFLVVASLLEDLNLLSSEIGRLALCASTVSDILSLSLNFIASFLRMVISGDKHLRIALLGLGAGIAHVLSLVFIFRPLMFWMIRQTPKQRPVKNIYINSLIVLAFISGILPHFYGQSCHFGFFLFGIAVPAGPPLGSALEEKFQVFISEVLIPIFATTYAMRADFWMVDLKDPATVLSAILVCFCFVVKAISAMVAPLFCRMPFNDAFVLALILSSKGIVQLATYTRFRDYQYASDSVYALIFASIAVTATLLPLIVKRLYDPSKKYAGYEKRDIEHLKPNSELRILATIHCSANISAVINLLNAACATKENPIDIYVLHLVELIGRASPVFISHQMQRKSASNASYSDNVILYFNKFVRENLGAVNLSIFTAISPPKYMHEDTCNLALDKIASLILLPFHRRWAIDGSIESEDNSIRMLNRNVLHTAPCSVGILVDRGHLDGATPDLAQPSLFYVAVIFLGGNDDREALSFAKRMTNDSTVSLTVIRLVPMNHNYAGVEWEKVLDDEALKEFRFCQRSGELDGFGIYLEEMVKDGPQTALTLRPVVNDYNLVIVGRRYQVECPLTAGLSEWSEFPELGTLGDYLASPDVNGKASIFIIKQQEQVG